MPELPEVETVRCSLEAHLPGRTIECCRILDVRAIGSKEAVTPKTFCRTLQGRRFSGVGRRGKYLILELDGGLWLITHLRMTGRLLYLPKAADVAKHTAVIFSLDNDHELRFVDQRKFGRMYLARKDEPCTWPSGLRALGPEPLCDTFDVQALNRVLKKSSRQIKALLLDQQHISGLGNIYADEALFQAGLHPKRRANTLGREETQLLHQAIQSVLRKGITYRGTTISSYVNGLGVPGNFQRHLQVYGREDEPCPRCQAPIKRVKVGGRSSYFCPRCQPPKTVVGLTGGIATGKTTVASMFRDLGTRVVDCDQLARKVVEPGKPAYKQIVEVFGPEYLREDGTLDRSRLGETVFSDPKARRRLEGIIHPIVLDKVREKIRQFRSQPAGRPLLVVDVPLLYETNSANLFDTVVVVYAPRKLQLERMRERDGLSRAAAERRLAAQWPIEKKKELADIVIDTSSSDLDEVRQQVAEVWERLTGLSPDKTAP